MVLNIHSYQVAFEINQKIVYTKAPHLLQLSEPPRLIWIGGLVMEKWLKPSLVQTRQLEFWNIQIASFTW
jgi:hypothetical protein